MRREHWQKIEEIFHAAVEYHGREREEYLGRVCKDDQDMLLEIVELLKEHESPSTSLGSSVLDVGLQIFDKPESGDRTGESIGHLRIGHLVGRGGMGEIYAAEDTKLGRKVAIKLVNELFALDAERISRFRKEADAASRVSHPNVAKLYELCEIDGEHLIVMELVDGVNLRQHLTELLSPGKAIDIAIQIASALTAAHAVGVVHRDIKPENIIITPDGTIKVLDFGLAKLVSPIGDGAIHIQGGENVKLTVDMSTELGALVGTPAYMSPEQIRGADVDTQTDIWSLGVVLYEMLAGQMPFRGSTKIDQIAAVLLLEPSPVRIDNVVGLDKINTALRKSLSKEKTSRYHNAVEFLNDLQAINKEAESRSDIKGLPYLFGARTRLKYAAGIVAVMALVIAVLPVTRQFISSKIFPPTQVIAQMKLPITDGLVSYWPADGNADDIVGGNNGELLNGATYRAGVSGPAFSFDGVDDLFQAPTNALPTGDSDRTMAMWVKLDDFTKLDFYDEPEEFFGGYGKFGGFEQAYFLGGTGNSLFFTNWGKGLDGGPLESGRWYYLVTTTKSNSTSLYVDGVVQPPFVTPIGKQGFLLNLGRV